MLSRLDKKFKYVFKILIASLDHLIRLNENTSKFVYVPRMLDTDRLLPILLSKHIL